MAKYIELGPNHAFDKYSDVVRAVVNKDERVLLKYYRQKIDKYWKQYYAIRKNYGPLDAELDELRYEVSRPNWKLNMAKIKRVFVLFLKLCSLGKFNYDNYMNDFVREQCIYPLITSHVRYYFNSCLFALVNNVYIVSLPLRPWVECTDCYLLFSMELEYQIEAMEENGVRKKENLMVIDKMRTTILHCRLDILVKELLIYMLWELSCGLGLTVEDYKKVIKSDKIEYLMYSLFPLRPYWHKYNQKVLPHAFSHEKKDLSGYVEECLSVDSDVSDDSDAEKINTFTTNYVYVAKKFIRLVHL